jgi:hypothetical protein
LTAFLPSFLDTLPYINFVRSYRLQRVFSLISKRAEVLPMTVCIPRKEGKMEGSVSRKEGRKEGRREGKEGRKEGRALMKEGRAKGGKERRMKGRKEAPPPSRSGRGRGRGRGRPPS